MSEQEQSRIFNLAFPRISVSDPVVYNVGQMFDVVTVIRAATINNKSCLMAIELRGPKAEIDKAVKYLTDHKVDVEQVQAEDIND